MNAIALTRRLVRFDTRNPPGSENACARFVADRLDAAGFQVQAYDFSFNFSAACIGKCMIFIFIGSWFFLSRFGISVGCRFYVFQNFYIIKAE